MALLPVTFLATGFNWTPFQDLATLSQGGLAILFSYHSYVSTSYILSDYVKKQPWALGCRILSAQTHLFATLGVLHYVYIKKNNIK